MLSHFKQNRPGALRCTKCGEEVPAGILNLSNHIDECKAFVAPVMNGTLSENDKREINRVLDKYNLNKYRWITE